MKNGKSIVIKFNLREGTIEAEASGYEGNACSLDVNTILKEIGQVTKRTMKRPQKDQNVHRVQRS